MQLAIETAMRAGEMLRICWKDVEFGARLVKLYKTKNGDDRDVPLSSRAVALLEGLQPARADPTARIFPDYARSDCYQKAWTRLKNHAKALANDNGWSSELAAQRFGTPCCGNVTHCAQGALPREVSVIKRAQALGRCH